MAQKQEEAFLDSEVNEEQSTFDVADLNESSEGIKRLKLDTTHMQRVEAEYSCQSDVKVSRSHERGCEGRVEGIEMSDRSRGSVKAETCQSPVRNDERPSTKRLDTPLSQASSGYQCEQGSKYPGEQVRGTVTLLQLQSRVPMPPDDLGYSRNHTVLVDVTASKKGGIVPVAGQCRWDSATVKMPNCQLGSYNNRLFGSDKTRWEIIEKQLSHLMKQQSVSSKDVEAAILKYNQKYKDCWRFDALHHFYSLSSDRRELSGLMKKIAELALRVPTTVTKAIPLLRRGHNHGITLSQEQIACLLANAFYCTFPHRNTTQPNSEYSNYPTINFASLFCQSSERKREKLKAIFNYFRIVTENCPQGLVTFERHCLSSKKEWRRSSEVMTNLYISSEGTIEKDGEGMLKVDFACNLVGGGVLSHGLVQEEILFLINTELIVARLFTERLGDEECLRVIGSQQFGDYRGYSDTFQYVGPHNDTTERDKWQRLQRQIVAIDAVHFRNQQEQYNMANITRELNKAYCGFVSDGQTPPEYLSAIATGNWGCGAFNGDPKLKALIQLMAAAAAHRDMAYFTFGNIEVEEKVKRLHNFLTKHQVTVGRLYQVLEGFCSMQTHSTPANLYGFIRNSIADTKSKH